MRTARLVMALSALVYAAMLAAFGLAGLKHFPTRALILSGALYAPLVRDGQLHRLLTACFIHVNLFHLITNMAALEAVGRVLEPHVGRRRFAALYLLSGLGGSLVSFLAHLAHPIASAGASGAICGLLGAAAVASHLKHDHRRRDAMLAWAMLVLVIGALAGADDAAHAGGLVTGALIAWLLDAGGRAARRAEARDPVGIEAAFLVVTVGAAFALAYNAREVSRSAPEYLEDAAVLAHTGRAAEAESSLRRALALEPSRADVHLALANLLLDGKRAAEAAAEARIATMLQPTSAAAWHTLASALGDTVQAAQAEDRATWLDHH